MELFAGKANLKLRDSIIRAIEEFFFNLGFLRVQTPVRIPAPAPEAHIDAISSEGWFLQTSPELCMKRLVAEGYHKIFQICGCFRKNERGERHISEFTMLEWYEAHIDYKKMMERCEQLVNFVAQKTGSGKKLSYQGKSVNINPPWKRIKVEDAFDEFSGMSMQKALETGKFDEIMAFEIEPNLGNDKPCFLYDYPAECGSLARLKPDNPDFAERFELYIAGMELCNAFTELTDPFEQRKRFEQELDFRKKAGKKAYPVDEKFLKALEKMPPTSGNALGVDRLVMIFANAAKIDDVVAFTPEEL